MNETGLRRRAHILELRGLRLSDLKTIVIDAPQEDLPKFYNDIPKTWTTGTDLICSDLRCWNCACLFNGHAAFIPMNAKNTAAGMTFDRYGNYCSWPCAARDANHRFGHQKNYSDIQQGLRMAFNSIHRTDINYVTQAPDRATMAEYCGNGGMNNNEYAQAIKKITMKMKE